MRSIFTKIWLWVIVTTIVSLMGFVLTTRLIHRNLPDLMDLFPKVLILARDNAQIALEEGGPSRLERMLTRLNKTFSARHFLIDDAGFDLVDGSDRSSFLHMAATFPEPPIQHGEKIFIVSIPTQGSRLLVELQAPGNPASLLPFYLWIFLLIAVFGYALAAYLGRPLRNLTKTVERFGNGELNARTSSTRNDEIGELARAFDRMAERTESLMTAQRRLLQDVSHELRSPLARLSLAIRLARTQEDGRNSLDRVTKDVDRLTTLVNELLALTEAEGDTVVRNRKSIHLHELLELISQENALEADAKQCRFQIELRNRVTVEADPELLRRSIENILRNALRHSPIHRTIEMMLDRKENDVILTVRDFGPGVDDDSLTQIFEPFYRVETDRNRSSGGVGLGLAIARRAISLHGGHISAANAHPGLLVTIQLPAENT